MKQHEQQRATKNTPTTTTKKKTRHTHTLLIGNYVFINGRRMGYISMTLTPCGARTLFVGGMAAVPWLAVMAVVMVVVGFNFCHAVAQLHCVCACVCVPHYVYALAMRQFTRQQVVNAHAATHTHTHASMHVNVFAAPSATSSNTTAMNNGSGNVEGTHTHAANTTNITKNAPTSSMILAPATIKYLTPLSRPTAPRREHAAAARLQNTHTHKCAEKWEVGRGRPGEMRCGFNIVDSF